MVLGSRLSRRDFLMSGIITAVGAMPWIVHSQIPPAQAQAQAQAPKTIEQRISDTIESWRWKALSDTQKLNSIRSWNDVVEGIYINPGNYTGTFTPENTEKYEQLTNAYERSMARTYSSSRNIFSTTDGSVTRDYDKRFPWIDLDFPEHSDILLIFAREVIDKDTDGKRLDWNYIKRNSKPRQFGDLGPLKMRVNGIEFRRQGNTNSYLDSKGNRLQVD